jgi:hypothetical protein
MEKYLPIGSVVRLKEAEKLLFMIIGLCVENENGEKRDYIAVRYPMGAINTSRYFFFNESAITDTIHMGYMDVSHTVYKDILENLIIKSDKNVK